MKIMYVVETRMKEFPKNCAECMMGECTLPCNARDNTKINKAYLKKRHKQCPLREV